MTHETLCRGGARGLRCATAPLMDTPFEAVVQAAGYETPYTSRGRGTPVVLVGATTQDRERLAALLVGEQRIIEPLPPVFQGGPGGADQGEHLGQWLLGFIEGLGIHAPRVFLAAAFSHSTPAISAILARVEAVVAVAAWPEED